MSVSECGQGFKFRNICARKKDLITFRLMDLICTLKALSGGQTSKNVNPRLGRQSIIWPKFSRKQHENERNWTQRKRGASLAPGVFCHDIISANVCIETCLKTSRLSYKL